MYYRRYTRMFLGPAFKYFSKYGVLDYQYERFTSILATQNPRPQQYRPKRDIKKLKEKDSDTKLIEKLFLKYPDLKYEPISHQKFDGKQLNTFSYAYAFLTQQKKLISKGYTADKAFQIVQAKYQQKMQRKLDQTLLSRRLAIGNRARSILTIYQQQSEYESKIKVLRTKRQLEKYLMKEEAVKNKVEGDGIVDGEALNYERILHQVVEKAELELEENKDSQAISDEGKKRYEKINDLEAKFKNMFKQFYERAESKDKLSGLTDEQLINSIKESPNRTKRQTKELLKYLKNLNANIKLVKGEVQVEGQINQNLKAFIMRSPGVKKALLNEKLNWERPNNYKPTNIAKDEAQIKQIFHNKKKFTNEPPEILSKEDKQQIQTAKKNEYELIASDQIPETRSAYKLFESEEERILRLEIKYFDILISQIRHDQLKLQNSEEKQKKQKQIAEIMRTRKKIVEKFRRLKFRLETRYRQMSREDLLFPEHEVISNKFTLEKDGEYENLISYLRKSSEERRLTSLDQSNDNRINKFLEKIPIQEDPDYTGSKNKREY